MFHTFAPHETSKTSHLGKFHSASLTFSGQKRGEFMIIHHTNHEIPLLFPWFSHGFPPAESQLPWRFRLHGHHRDRGRGIQRPGGAEQLGALLQEATQQTQGLGFARRLGENHGKTMGKCWFSMGFQGVFEWQSYIWF